MATGEASAGLTQALEARSLRFSYTGYRPGKALLASTRTAVRIVLTAFLGLAGCASQPSADEAIAQRLIGKWTEVIHGDDIRAQQTVEVNGDGTMRATGERHSVAGIERYGYGGPWRVENGVFRWTLQWVEPAGWFPTGQEYGDRIVLVSDVEWVMIEESIMRETRKRRYPK